MMLLYSEFIEILDTGKVMSSIADFLYSTTGKAYNMIQTNWRERERGRESTLYAKAKCCKFYFQNVWLPWSSEYSTEQLQEVLFTIVSYNTILTYTLGQIW